MSTGARTDAMDSWESLIASRMRPCATMPKEEDTSKRALYKALTNWAKERSLYYYSAVPNRRRCRLWEKVETKCRAMADKFKEADDGNDKL